MGVLGDHLLPPNTPHVEITNLAGTGFEAWAKVKLQRWILWWQQTIGSYNVEVTEQGTKINCSFDLSAYVYSTWNVVVENPDGTKATLPYGFVIQ